MLKKYILKYKWLFLLSLVMSILMVGSQLYQPRLISEIIKNLNALSLGASDSVLDAIHSATNMMLFVGLIALLAGIINTLSAARVAQNTGSDMRRDIFDKVQGFGYSDIEQFSTSNLVVRMTNDVTQIQNFLMIFFQLVLRVPLMFIGGFVFAVIAIPQLWWVIIVYVVLIALIIVVTMSVIGPNFGKMQKNIDNVNSAVKENLEGVRVVKSFATEEKENEKLEGKVDTLTKITLKIGYGFSAMIPMFMLVANFAIAFVIYFVGNNSVGDIELISQLTSFINYLMIIAFSMMMFGFVSMIMGRAIVSIKRVNEVLQMQSSIIYGNEEMNDSASSLEFKNVSFTYPNSDEEILTNVSFDVKQGESVGIVGSTASGKTSLVSLIPRLYDVSSGEILIDGVNVQDYTHQTLSDNISLVLQKPQLISGTIRETISEGKKGADENDLLKAAKDAQAFEFIDKNDNGFDGEVLQRGNNFSGGQKQRLSIARGFIKNPALLILDDSTSALDARSENRVKEALRENYKNMTKIIVSQKISSVVDLDKIIVLSEGHIDAIGTHKELLKTSEVYKEIYETQKGKAKKGGAK